MRDFSSIEAIAAERSGGPQALQARLAETPSRAPEEIAATPDDRLLAAMTRRVFSAGFSSKVIEAKWPDFENAFHGFDPRACAALSEEEFDARVADRRLVRNGAKIRSVQLNAILLRDLAAEHGTAARFFADWPDGDYAELVILLKKRGDHLGGDSGMRFLRSIGKPAFIPTRDVVAALVREEVLSRAPAADRDLRAIQRAFNAWSEQSGRNLTEISRILALSIDGPSRH